MQKFNFDGNFFFNYEFFLNANKFQMVKWIIYYYY